MEILEAMLALRSGAFAYRLPPGWTGVYGKIADAFNEVATMNKRRSEEMSRVCRVRATTPGPRRTPTGR